MGIEPFCTSMLLFLGGGGSSFHPFNWNIPPCSTRGYGANANPLARLPWLLLEASVNDPPPRSHAGLGDRSAALARVARAAGARRQRAGASPSIMAPSAHRPGFWGSPTSTLDWCEENYLVSGYIAEFCESPAPPLGTTRCLPAARGSRARGDAAALASLAPLLLHWRTSEVSALMTSPRARHAPLFLWPLRTWDTWDRWDTSHRRWRE